MTKPDKKQMKSAARLYAVQALFQMEASGQTVESVVREFETHRFGAVVLVADRIGARMGGLWLGVAYLTVVAPFRLFARLEPGGWQRPERGGSTLDAARRES